MSTFLDKIEEGIQALREELVKAFGDHSAIHNLTSDFKAHVLMAAVTHFGEPVTPVAPKEDEETHLEESQESPNNEGTTGSASPPV